MHSPFSEFLLAFISRMDAAHGTRGDRSLHYGLRVTVPALGEGEATAQIHFINTQRIGSAIDADELARLSDLAKSYGLRLTPGSLSGVYAVTLRSAPAPEVIRAPGLRSEDLLPPPQQPWQDTDELTRAETAARLGCSVRYLRTLTETKQVPVHRISRKVHRYVWGQVKEAWKKLGKPTV